VIVMLKITDPNLIFLDFLIEIDAVLHFSLTQLTSMFFLEITKLSLKLADRSFVCILLVSQLGLESKDRLIILF
jgi:hypothetical protein